MSPLHYDEMKEKQRFLQALARGLIDIENGRVLDDSALSEVLDRELS